MVGLPDYPLKGATAAASAEEYVASVDDEVPGILTWRIGCYDGASLALVASSFG